MHVVMLLVLLLVVAVLLALHILIDIVIVRLLALHLRHVLGLTHLIQSWLRGHHRRPGDVAHAWHVHVWCDVRIDGIRIQTARGSGERPSA